MARGQHLLNLTQRRVLVVLPDLRVQGWRGPPRVRRGQEWAGGPVLIGFNEVEQHFLPRVEVGKDVAQILVPAPVGFMMVEVSAEKQADTFYLGSHGVN